MPTDELLFWLKLGFQHILDWNGYDHMLFLWVSFAVIQKSDFKAVLWKISAFTLAHSLTLALSVFNLIPGSTQWVEAAIALSIAISALWHWKKSNSQRFEMSMVLIFSFGLIHGLGFSSLLLSLLGKSSSIVLPLLSFNAGLEIGQLFFVSLLILAHQLLFRFKPLWVNSYTRITLSLGFVIGIALFFERILGYIR
jgi:hypothetical protein